VSPGTRIAVAVLLVAAAGPAGFFAYRALLAHHLLPQPEERQLTAELAASSRPSTAAAAFAPGAATPVSAASDAPETPEKAIPEQLPDIAFPDRQGSLRKLSDWRGRPLLVNFWATWCEPCRREIPLLESLLRSGGADRLQIVGIAVDDRAPVLKYASAMKIDYPVLIGGLDGGLKAIDTFGMAEVLPFSVFADGKGRILTVKVGELHLDEVHLILARLQDVEKGRLTLPAAQEQITAGLKTLAVQRAKDSASASPPAKS
jgi:thiol-disulfide isomerase/thioredoxin